MIGYCHHIVVCPSVCDEVYCNVWPLNDTSYSKSV